MSRVLKNLHLIISSLIVVPTAIIYGFIPSIVFFQPSDTAITTNNINFLKAIMGLYIAISLIWFLGIWKLKYWKMATQSNALFMLSLAAGRLISVALDGMPTREYFFAIIAELALGIYAVYQLYAISSVK